ncbi:MAG: MFS transporter [Thermoprotei archaeon]
MGSGGIFKEMDQAKLSKGHLKVWFTSGMGFFTDAYDLFIIGAVIDLFSKYQLQGFSLNGELLGLTLAGFLGASAIFAAVAGQLLFGFVADKIGRKTVYGVEATILAVGALLSALSPTILWLILFRFIQGVGIGGDYPVSATIMSEYSNTKDRGKLVSLVFANQGLGSVAAVIVGLVCVVFLPPAVAWRIMLAAGALPAMAVIYFRRRLPETARYSLLSRGDTKDAALAAGVVGASISGQGEEASVRGLRLNAKGFLAKYGKMLFVTAGSWFLLDMAFYGTGVFSGPIVSSIVPVSSTLPIRDQLTRLVLEAGIPFIVGFAGYFAAAAMVDRLGRKLIQLQGFLGMTILYLLVSVFMITSGLKVIGFSIPSGLALAVYALTYFFIDFGPNTMTFVVPAEVYPVRYRTSGHGISAAAGKLGAALTVLYFPTFEATIGLKGIMGFLALVSAAGALITLLMKETRGLTLEEASGEEVEVGAERH